MFNLDRGTGLVIRSLLSCVCCLSDYKGHELVRATHMVVTVEGNKNAVKKTASDSATTFIHCMCVAISCQPTFIAGVDRMSVASAEKLEPALRDT
jgi:hypothetical protein